MDCNNNQLTSLDVSQNLALTSLSCYNNKLISFNVSNGILTMLDVSNNLDLTYLYCSNNQLTSLDVSNNLALTDLYCSNNQLPTLNVSNTLALNKFYCNNNHLTSLDVSQNSALTDFDCSINHITSLDLSNLTYSFQMTWFAAKVNPLYCILVQDTIYYNLNFINFIPSSASFNQPAYNMSIVECNSYTWPVTGLPYTMTGTYTNTSTNTAGCEQTDTLYLTIDNSTSNSTTIIKCDSSYFWSVTGLPYTTSGTYTNTGTNSNGCIHTETLDLTINNSTSSTTNKTACDSYIWPVTGQTFTTSGIYTNISTNTAGCVHIDTLDLTINNSSSSPLQ